MSPTTPMLTRPLQQQTPAANASVDCFVPSQPAEWTPPKRPATVLPNGETAAWGDFALGRHKPGTGYSYFEGTPEQLLERVGQHWEERRPGVGRTDVTEVVSVPVPADGFLTTTVAVTPETKLQAELYRRRESEAPYVRVTAAGQPEPAKFANVILYSAATLGQNNEQSTTADWEVVSVVASPVEDEPMDPVTMMRNMRGKAGGTQVNYTADQLLDSIEFWSTHTKLKPPTV